MVQDREGNLSRAGSQNHPTGGVGREGPIRAAAGTGIAGSSGDGGPAVAARLASPMGIAVDAGGNLYFADCLIWHLGRVWPDGLIKTAAGNGPIGST